MHNYLFSTLLASGVALGLAGTPSTAHEPTWEGQRGAWVGMGQQQDGHSWPIYIDFRAQGQIAINYPSLKCGGTLTHLSHNDRSFRFRETLKFGQQSCSNGGTVVITPLTSDRLRYEWKQPDGTTSGWAVLRRHANAPPPPAQLI